MFKLCPIVIVFLVCFSAQAVVFDTKTGFFPGLSKRYDLEIMIKVPGACESVLYCTSGNR